MVQKPLVMIGLFLEWLGWSFATSIPLGAMTCLAIVRSEAPEASEPTLWYDLVLPILFWTACLLIGFLITRLRVLARRRQQSGDRGCEVQPSPDAPASPSHYNRPTE